MATTTSSMPVSGMIVPVITPLRSDGQVDHERLHAHCRRCIDGGIDVLFALGTTGEFYGLSPAQRQAVVQTVLAAAQAVPVVVGISGESTASTIDTYDRVRDTRIAGYVVSTPYFLDYSQGELCDHFRAVSAHIAAPIILYNYPERYRHRIDISSVAALVVDGTTGAIKDTAGDFAYVRELMAIKREHPHFRVFPSHLQDLGRASALGIDGSVQALGNLLPGECAAFWRLAREGTDGALLELQRRVDHLWRFSLSMTASAPFISALKGAMSALGWCAPLTVAPTRPLDQRRVAELVQEFQRAYPVMSRVNAMS